MVSHETHDCRRQRVQIQNVLSPILGGAPPLPFSGRFSRACRSIVCPKRWQALSKRTLAAAERLRPRTRVSVTRAGRSSQACLLRSPFHCVTVRSEWWVSRCLDMMAEIKLNLKSVVSVFSMPYAQHGHRRSISCVACPVISCKSPSIPVVTKRVFMWSG